LNYSSGQVIFKSNDQKTRRKKGFALWVKRFGAAEFMFFLVKGWLWLIVPALITYFAW